MTLDGKVALITGGARGIAKGVALAFAKAGATVVIVDRESDLGAATEAELRELGGEALFLPADLSEHDSLETLVAATVGRFGKLDILVNGAQASVQLPIVGGGIADARIAFDTGFWPTLILMRAAYPHLVETKGNVINFGSGSAFDALPNLGLYSAAKEAIRAMSKTAAVEWGAQGVRVNMICPFANSPGVQAWSKFDPQAYQAQIGKVPLRRIGDCEHDIGAAALFLASEAASYITGHTLMVDGFQTKAF